MQISSDGPRNPARDDVRLFRQSPYLRPYHGLSPVQTDHNCGRSGVCDMLEYDDLDVR